MRIIRSLFPPIDLFEDIADPADWPLLISAEMKTNARLMESIGRLDLMPPERRVSGPGASLLMAPFIHVSTDRPSRFSDGTYGVLYVGRRFETGREKRPTSWRCAIAARTRMRILDGAIRMSNSAWNLQKALGIRKLRRRLISRPLHHQILFDS